MRCEVISAWVIGILLPVLETCRRGIDHWGVDATTMVEDYLAGLLLLFAATMSICGKRSAPLWLILAWGSVTGMMTMSFFDQLETTLRGEVTEPRNGIVLFVKFLLWGTCMIALALSFKRASKYDIVIHS